MSTKILKILHPSNFIKAPYQLFFLVVIMCINTYVIRKPLREFHPQEQFPKMFTVTDELIQQWGKKPVEVKVGMYINEFTTFDVNKKHFEVNATVWFIFNPHEIELKKIENFSFKGGKIIQKTFADKPLAQVDKSDPNEMVATYNISIDFSSLLTFQRFPLDDHRLFLTLTHLSLSPREVIFTSDTNSFKTDEDLNVFGWSFKEKGVRTGFSESIVNDAMSVSQPQVVFYMGFSKYDVRQFLFLLLPLLFLFYLGIFAFAFQDSKSLLLTSLPALLGFNVMMQSVIPVAGYFLLTDYLFLYFGIGTFIIFCVRALKENSLFGFSEKQFAEIAGITMLGLNIGFMVLWYYLTNIKELV